MNSFNKQKTAFIAGVVLFCGLLLKLLINNDWYLDEELFYLNKEEHLLLSIISLLAGAFTIIGMQETNKKKSTRRCIVGITIGAILLVGVIISFLFKADNFSKAPFFYINGLLFIITAIALIVFGNNKKNLNNTVKLIYKLIQKDLKDSGWNSIDIAEAIAECQRERQVTGANDGTLCVKEVSYLSQSSLQTVAKRIDAQKSNNLYERVKQWHLNWEVIIGVVFLIPPIWGTLVFILRILGASFKKGLSSYLWSGDVTYAIFMGLMAIAGAYLLKGNLKKNK